MKKKYDCRWHGVTTHNKVADVTIMARSDFDAKQQADKVEREINVANCTRTIYQGNRQVE